MRHQFKKLWRWDLLKLLKEDKEPSFLKIRSLLKSKLGKNFIELKPIVIATKKTFLKIFPGKANIFLYYYILNNNSPTFVNVVIKWVFQGLLATVRTFLKGIRMSKILIEKNIFLRFSKLHLFTPERAHLVIPFARKSRSHCVRSIERLYCTCTVKYHMYENIRWYLFKCSSIKYTARPTGFIIVFGQT